MFHFDPIGIEGSLWVKALSFKYFKYFLGPIVIVIIAAMPSTLYAALSIELDGFLSTDNFKNSETTADSKSVYSLDFLANLDNKKQFYAGFHVGQVAVTETLASTTTTTFSSLDMGPFIAYMFDQKGSFSLSLGYNVKSTGTYNDGTNLAAGSGTSVLASFGVMPAFGENFYLGFKLNYYAATYTKEVVTTTASDISYTRTLVYPTFGLAWRY